MLWTEGSQFIHARLSPSTVEILSAYARFSKPECPPPPEVTAHRPLNFSLPHNSAAMVAWVKLTDTEVTLAKKWYIDGETTAEIGERLGRNQSTITRLLVKRVARKKQGRKAALDTTAVDKLEAKLAAMVKGLTGGTR